MKRLIILMTVVVMLMTAGALKAQNYGITFGDLEVTEENADDIFGDGMATYNAAINKLVLRNGFEYHLSHGLVTIQTGGEFRIALEGDAEIVASIDCSDPLVIMAETVEDGGYLKITSNISGSAVKCPSLHVTSGVFLDLLSRNSQENMYALECEELTVLGSKLYAEVTTAQLAVAVQEMNLYGCWLKKPLGGGINETWGGICFADGVPAKQVSIVVEGFGVEEMEDVVPNASIEKVYENGQIVIIKDGKRYDVTGRILH